MIRKRCKAIMADRMLTFSTRENETRLEVWAAWWDEFRRRLNRTTWRCWNVSSAGRGISMWR
jgi:hypothetical protein